MSHPYGYVAEDWTTRPLPMQGLKIWWSTPSQLHHQPPPQDFRSLMLSVNSSFTCAKKLVSLDWSTIRWAASLQYKTTDLPIVSWHPLVCLWEVWHPPLLCQYLSPPENQELQLLLSHFIPFPLPLPHHFHHRHNQGSSPLVDQLLHQLLINR